MVAIIRSLLARIVTQRESDDALNMDFFSKVAKLLQEIHLNQDRLLTNVRNNACDVNHNFGCALVFSGKSIFA